MPVAFTQETITQQWSAALLRAAITTKILSMGGWVQDAGTSGSELHFSIDAPLTSAPKDRAYLRLLVEQSTATNIKIQAWALSQTQIDAETWVNFNSGCSTAMRIA